MPLPDLVVEDGFQVYQAWFGPTRQMQSYYGPLPGLRSTVGRVLSPGRPCRFVRWNEDNRNRELQAPAGPMRIRAAHESAGLLFSWASPKPTKGSNAI